MAKQKCPECGCTEIWDEDCNECDGEGFVFNEDHEDEECENCYSAGFIQGSCECSACGYIDDEHRFDNED